MRLMAEFFFMLLWAMSFSLIALFLVARMLWVGLSVTPTEIRATLRARGFLTRALLANVLVVPALAVLLVSVLPLSGDARLAILLLAAVPGGIDFLVWKDSPGAGARSPAALVFLLSIVAVVVAPVMRILVQQFGPPLALSYTRLVVASVLGLLVPLLAGLAIRRAAPAAAEMLTRVMAVVSVVLFVAANLAIVIVHGAQRRVGALDVVAMVLFVAGAAAVGWLAGGPAAPTRRRLARVTAMRNVGLSLLIATVGVPHGGVGLAIVVFVVVLIVLRVIVAGLAVVRRRRLAVDAAMRSV